MTSDRFLECLDLIGWPVRGFAAYINVSDREVRRWASGVNRIPGPIADWLERIASFHEANPPPPPPVRADAGPVVFLDE